MVEAAPTSRKRSLGVNESRDVDSHDSWTPQAAAESGDQVPLHARLLRP